MTRLAVVSLTVLLASTAVAAYADPGDGQGRQGRGRDGGGEARSEWRQRGGPQQNSNQQNDVSRNDAPRDPGRRPDGGVYVPRNGPAPTIAQPAQAAPQAPPAAVANNGGRPGGRSAEGVRDAQGWRGAPGGPPGGFQDADRDTRRRSGEPPAAFPRNYGDTSADQRARGGGGSGPQDDSRRRGAYGLDGARDGARGPQQNDVRRYGDGGRDNRGDDRGVNPGSDRWTERGHDRANYDNRGGDRRYDADHGYRGRPGDGHDFRDRDRGRSWYNPQHFHQEYRATYRYRAPPYRYPHGWFERTWYYGDYLPGGWYSTSYYLDWRAFGLGYPPIGCEWIRVGRDALLVDIWSGEVLSVYYDLFW